MIKEKNKVWYETRDCFWCLKKFSSKNYPSKIIEEVTVCEIYCSKKCRKLSKLQINMIIVLEDLDKIKKKMRGKRKA